MVPLLIAVGALAVWVTHLSLNNTQEELKTQGAVRQAHEQSDQAGKKQAAEFEAMTPAQHLNAALQATQPGATFGQFDEGLRHLNAIPKSAPEAAKAKALEQKITNLKKRRHWEISRAQAESERKNALLQAQAKRMLRDQMAKEIENKMLSEGYDVDVVAIGNEHTVLHLKWVLASKSLVYQMSQQTEFFENAKTVGFKRIEITDGFDQAWHWNLGS